MIELLEEIRLSGVKLQRVSVVPKTILLEEGEVADRLYFVEKGCLRLFFLHDGKDVTFQFFTEGEMVASFNSMLFRQPSDFSLESIEASELITMSRDDFTTLIDSNHKIREYYEKKLIERFSAYQKLFLSHIKLNPRQRYERLMKEQPELIRRVPQHYIASYLGITSVSLSRIRGRKTHDS